MVTLVALTGYWQNQLRHGMFMNRYLQTLAFLLFSSGASASEGGFIWTSSLAHTLHLPNHVVTFAIVAILLCVAGVSYRISTRKLSCMVVPGETTSLRNIIEALGEFLYGLCKSVLGEKDAQKHYTTIGSIFILIFFSNLIGLIPGFLPPTDNINTTLALGAFVFLYYNYHGIRTQGVVGHIKHFLGPVWYLAFLIFPIELISHAVRPVSLALRLRGNMFGDHLVLGIFSDLVPWIVPIPFMVLGLFVCFIQAFVFTLLTMVYISLATAHHDEEHAS